MHDYFLSPHNDDETLFGAYTLLRHRPHVIVCLRSFIEAGWPNGPGYATREQETAEACRILGASYEQWTFPDSAPNWLEIEQRLRQLEEPRTVWAPLPEPGGHPHHNSIGALAGMIFPDVRYYATYVRGGEKTTAGERVTPEPGWYETKRRAMACYVSQATHPNTHLPFDTWPVDEYLSSAS